MIGELNFDNDSASHHSVTLKQADSTWKWHTQFRKLDQSILLLIFRWINTIVKFKYFFSKVWVVFIWMMDKLYCKWCLLKWIDKMESNAIQQRDEALKEKEELAHTIHQISKQNEREIEYLRNLHEKLQEI